MMNSSRLINYGLRPSKTIERKMLCDLFRKLEAFDYVYNYRYIGLGAFYFIDFQLFHKILGISDMISIEEDTSSKARYEFNKPYRCIEIKMGSSNVILPSLTWDKRCIIWLDYDGKFDKSVLADISTVCAEVKSGTVLLLSFNIELDRLSAKTPEETNLFRIEELKKRVGDDKVPIGIKGSNLRKGEYNKICSKIVNNEIKKELSIRNGPLSDNNKFYFNNLINIIYKDNAPMLTLGGIFVRADENDKFKNCGFEELAFVSIDENPYEIKAPNLTPKEIHFLNSKLPSKRKIILNWIPESDIDNYKKVYRFYPDFREVIF